MVHRMAAAGTRLSVGGGSSRAPRPLDISSQECSHGPASPAPRGPPARRAYRVQPGPTLGGHERDPLVHGRHAPAATGADQPAQSGCATYRLVAVHRLAQQRPRVSGAGAAVPSAAVADLLHAGTRVSGRDGLAIRLPRADGSVRRGGNNLAAPRHERAGGPAPALVAALACIGHAGRLPRREPGRTGTRGGSGPTGRWTDGAGLFLRTASSQAALRWSRPGGLVRRSDPGGFGRCADCSARLADCRCELAATHPGASRSGDLSPRPLESRAATGAAVARVGPRAGCRLSAWPALFGT